jgi:hypothetical protein
MFTHLITKMVTLTETPPKKIFGALRRAEKEGPNPYGFGPSFSALTTSKAQMGLIVCKVSGWIWLRKDNGLAVTGKAEADTRLLENSEFSNLQSADGRST